MSLFDKLFLQKEKIRSNNKNSEKVIGAMLALAESFLNEGKARQAVEQYETILKLCPNATALYNLGSLYAQGKGTTRDYCEAAYYFRQAEKNGDTAASKMVRKCELDYMSQNLDGEVAAELYERMQRFILRVYQEDAEEINIGQELSALGSHYLDKKEYPKAIKLFRAAAEFCNNGQAQNALGVIYNVGTGVSKNDLISLYWFDRAADQGIAAAKTDRKGLLNAYCSNLSVEEFAEYMDRIACWCREGTEGVPKMPKKADTWHSIAQEARQNGLPVKAVSEGNLNPDQEREKVVRGCTKKMPELIHKQTDPDGVCSPFRLRFKYPGTDNIGFFEIEKSKRTGKPYTFKIGVFRVNTDLLVSSYMKMGTLEDILAYLLEESKLTKMVSTFQKLSDSVDERW